MIVPITQSKNGVKSQIGTAHVEVMDGEVVINFYLIPHHSLSDQVKKETKKKLTELYWKNFGGPNGA